MAFLKHVFTALTRGQTTFSLLNPAKCADFQRVCSFSSLTQSASKICQEITKPAWICAAPNNVLSMLSLRFYRRKQQRRRLSRKQWQAHFMQSVTKQPPVIDYNPALVEELLNSMEGDQPLSTMPDPFQKDYRRCFICRYNIEVDYKNIRLLSQFVSPYTGRIYGRQITGLCLPMQRHISNLIHRARWIGFMPIILKDPRYLQDPQPYDAMKKTK